MSTRTLRESCLARTSREGRNGSSATGIVSTQCRRMLCEAPNGVRATREPGRATRRPEPPGFSRGETQGQNGFVPFSIRVSRSNIFIPGSMWILRSRGSTSRLVLHICWHPATMTGMIMPTIRRRHTPMSQFTQLSVLLGTPLREGRRFLRGTG